MKLTKAMDLSKQYESCPECGNNHIGGGEGKLIIGNSFFMRSCKCGWKVQINYEKCEVNTK